jgi:hypothetical protein
MGIINLITAGLRVVAAIIDLIGQKGEDAGAVRLSDVDGWDELQAEALQDEARAEFLKKYRESRETD